MTFVNLLAVIFMHVSSAFVNIEPRERRGAGIDGQANNVSKAYFPPRIIQWKKSIDKYRIVLSFVGGGMGLDFP